MTAITRRLVNLVWVAALLAGSASAQDLSLPEGARLTRDIARNPSSYALPTAGWDAETGLAVRVIEGPVTLRSYRIDGSGLTALQLIAPLRDALEAAGATLLLDCDARACGGFDFRFATEVLPAPAMYVDLSDFRFVSALMADGSAVSVLSSVDRDAGFLQIVQAGRPAVTLKADGAKLAAVAAPPATGSLAERLEQRGRVVLSDLVFASGAAALADGAVASLDDLADYLKQDASRRIAFVGHTDATGSLEANQALSKRRAQAAVTYLRQRHSVPSAQIMADGVGYLAPIQSNLTKEGRDANRRVEAVLLQTR